MADTPRRPLGANYWKLWIASVISNFGDGVALIAYPWLASAVTRSPLQIALVGVATRLPWLFFTLPAGVITDRVDRRRLVVAMDAMRAVITVGVAASRPRQSKAPCPLPSRSRRPTLSRSPPRVCCSALSTCRRCSWEWPRFSATTGPDADARGRRQEPARKGQRAALGRRDGDELVRRAALGGLPARRGVQPSLLHRLRHLRGFGRLARSR